MATSEGGRWFFLYGFEKSDRSNIGAKELEGLKAIAADLSKLSIVELETLAANSRLIEVNHG